MALWKSTSLVTLVVFAATLLIAENPVREVRRDADAIDILKRAAAAAGGLAALSSIHDLTESGEITFNWGKGVKGPVTIRALGGNHFRMEADLPEGKSTWIVKDGVGSKKEKDRENFIPISRENALNFGNLTYPVGHVAAALADATADVSFVGIEKWEGRSVYRLRVKGRLGLVQNGSPASVVKDVIVDALTFEILSIEDHPYKTYKRGGKLSDIAPREIDFADFRAVNGVRVPFAISTKLQGQLTLSIHLSEVTFNNNLNATDFQVQK